MFLASGLFTLIKGLSTNEKKYFCQFIEFTKNDNKIYYNMFRDIDKMEIFNENTLKLKYGKSYGGNLGMLKEKLYEQILNALHNYYRENKADNQIIKWTQDAKILIKKGLYKLAVKKIDKALNYSLTLDRYLLAQHLISLKKTAFMHQQYYNVSENEIQDLLNLENKIAASILSLTEANNAQFLYYFHLSKNNQTETSTISDKIKQKLNNKEQLRGEKLIYYNIIANYYETQDKLKEASRFIEKYIEELKIDPYYQNEYYGNYILQSFNFISLLIMQGNIEIALTKLQSLKLENQNNKPYKHLTESLYYSNLYLCLAKNGNLTNYDTTILEMQKHFQIVRVEISPNLEKHIIYCRAVLLWNIGNYKTCIQYIQLNMDKIYIVDYSFLRFLILMIACFFKLNDPSAIRHTFVTYNSLIKYARKDYFEDSFLLLLATDKLKDDIELTSIIKNLSHKKTNRELYFPLELAKNLA